MVNFIFVISMMAICKKLGDNAPYLALKHPPISKSYSAYLNEVKRLMMTDPNFYHKAKKSGLTNCHLKRHIRRFTRTTKEIPQLSRKELKACANAIAPCFFSGGWAFLSVCSSSLSHECYISLIEDAKLCNDLYKKNINLEILWGENVELFKTIIELPCFTSLQINITELLKYKIIQNNEFCISSYLIRNIVNIEKKIDDAYLTKIIREHMTCDDLKAVLNNNKIFFKPISGIKDWVHSVEIYTFLMYMIQSRPNTAYYILKRFEKERLFLEHLIYSQSHFGWTAFTIACQHNIKIAKFLITYLSSEVLNDILSKILCNNGSTFLIMIQHNSSLIDFIIPYCTRETLVTQFGYIQIMRLNSNHVTKISLIEQVFRDTNKVSERTKMQVINCTLKYLNKDDLLKLLHMKTAEHIYLYNMETTERSYNNVFQYIAKQNEGKYRDMIYNYFKNNKQFQLRLFACENATLMNSNKYNEVTNIDGLKMMLPEITENRDLCLQIFSSLYLKCYDTASKLFYMFNNDVKFQWELLLQIPYTGALFSNDVHQYIKLMRYLFLTDCQRIWNYYLKYINKLIKLTKKTPEFADMIIDCFNNMPNTRKNYILHSLHILTDYFMNSDYIQVVKNWNEKITCSYVFLHHECKVQNKIYSNITNRIQLHRHLIKNNPHVHGILYEIKIDNFTFISRNENYGLVINLANHQNVMYQLIIHTPILITNCWIIIFKYYRNPFQNKGSIFDLS